MSRRRFFTALAGILLILLIIWITWGNSALMTSVYRISGAPAAFDGFRIAQISDLHNTEFGAENEELLAQLRQAEPDIIVLTGDLIDSRRTDLDVAIRFAGKAAAIAPCYYVNGNHESRIAAYGELKAALQAAGVTVLENESVLLARGDDKIRLIGVKDPGFSNDINAVLPSLRGEEYQILLAHRPELFKTYVNQEIDLVFAGHAHGGQIRLPLIGGVFAPGQGLFPAYDAGVYTESGTSMIVSRGLGNSLFPFRVNNRPELVVAELHM